MSRYAVIGSNCFTGCHIVDALLADPGNDVIGVSRSPEYKPFFLPYASRPREKFRFHQIDMVREPERLAALLDEFEPEYVINPAALSEVGLSNYQPVEYFNTNTVSVVSLAHHLRQKKYVKMYVQVSTPEIYGTCVGSLDENAPYNPSTPYAASKAAGDMFLKILHKNFGFPVVFIRSTNVYGRHQQLFKIIPRTVIYLKQEKKIELHGGGMAVKTWVHVRDVVDGILAAIRANKPGEVYHFGDVHSVSVADLVKKVCGMMGRSFEESTLAVGERLGQDARYVLDYAKAQRTLGWNPRVPFETGLAETIEWIDENWDAILKEPHVYVHKA